MKLSPWTPVPSAPYCCARVCEGGDIEKVADRFAFIEKTPRIRLTKWQYSVEQPGRVGGHAVNADAWVEGPKGAGGWGGEDPVNQLYGFYPPSRQWCDDMLRLLGYELS